MVASASAEVPRVLLARVTDEVLDEGAHRAAVARADVGAVVGFAGTVRDHDPDHPGRRVVALRYEAHPEAEDVLAGIAADVGRLEGVLAVAVSHRVGDLAVGEAALVAAVASAHRAEAFAACGALVELVKERLPVWKRQVFADGGHEWVHCA